MTSELIYDSGKAPRKRVPKPNPPPFDKCLSLLEKRAYSRAEIEKKLHTLSYSQAEITTAVQKCENLGLLNDQLLATEYARVRSQAGMGLHRIEFDLKKRGLDASLSPLQKEELTQLEPERALAALQKKKAALLRETDPQKRAAKAWRFLASRGFNGDAISEAWNQFSRSPISQQENLP